MATVISAAVTANNPYQTLGLYSRSFTMPVTVAEIAVSNVLQVIPVFAGETVVSLEVTATDLDTNGTPAILLGVGDAGDNERFIADSNVAQTTGESVTRHQRNAPYQYPADDTIDVVISTAAATAAAGSITVTALLQAK